MEYKSVLKEKSFEVGVSLLRILYSIQRQKHEFNLTGQLIRSATSIHANLQESSGAGSRRDFLARVIISRKEAYETISWISFLKELQFISTDVAEKYLAEYIIILKMLNKTVETVRQSGI